MSEERLQAVGMQFSGAADDIPPGPHPGHDFRMRAIRGYLQPVQMGRVTMDFIVKEETDKRIHEAFKND